MSEPFDCTAYELIIAAHALMEDIPNGVDPRCVHIRMQKLPCGKIEIGASTTLMGLDVVWHEKSTK